MHPILFEIGGFPVGSYALMALLGLAAAAALSSWLAGRDGLDRMAWVELVLWTFIVAITASKVFGAALDFNAADPGGSLLRSLRFGGTWYVGFLAGVAFVVWGFRKRGLHPLHGMDILAPGMALGHAFGRVGCYLAGCCWGTACDLPWAVTFTSPEAHQITGVPLGVPLHPAQLYDAGIELLNCALLLAAWFRWPRTWPGRIFFQQVIFYGACRFLLELVRDDPRGQPILGLSTSQALALLLVVTCGLAWVVLARRAARAPAPAPAPARKSGKKGKRS